MERLTKRYIDEDDGRKSIGAYTGYTIPEIWFEGEREYRVLDKLATYEDLEEQGLLVRLPCKVGDTVWVMTHPMNVDDSVYSDENLQIFESYVASVTVYDDSRQYRIHDKKTRNPIVAYFQDRDFGEFIFLTREEAEKKLEEMKNGKK